MYFGYFIGHYVMGSSLQEVDYTVYVEDEEQVFRSENGTRLSARMIDDVMYVPITEIGTYLGYMPMYSEDSLHLYEIEDSVYFGDFEVVTKEGSVLTNEVFAENNYTMFLVGSTWCPHCVETMESLAEYNEYFIENNIVIYAKVLDSEEDGVTEEMVEEYLGEVVISQMLSADDTLNTLLVGNAVTIPKLVVVDNSGDIVKVFDGAFMGEDVYNYFELWK